MVRSEEKRERGERINRRLVEIGSSVEGLSLTINTCSITS
jgi:hypothetical protein